MSASCGCTRRRECDREVAAPGCRVSCAQDCGSIADCVRNVERQFRVVAGCARAVHWGVAKLVKAPDFDSGIRGFESFLPCQSITTVTVTLWQRDMAFDNLMVFTGSANPKLAQEVARQLNIQLGKATVVEVQRRRGDGRDPRERPRQGRVRAAVDLRADQRQPDGDDDHGRCAARARRGRITAAMPYFGYARQDRRPRSARVAISAKVVANMLHGRPAWTGC